MSDTTVSWYITFGIGGPHGKQYTEVKVPAELSYFEQAARARKVAVERYGRTWAFDYPPQEFEESIARYGLTVREVIEA